MRRLMIVSCLAAAVTAVTTLPAHARDTEYKLPILDVLNLPDYQDKIGLDVQFFFGDQKTPAIQERMGEFTTNKKTNAVNKTDEEACRWVMLSALISLKEKALQLGGNAVIDIKSYYKKDTFSSSTEYECHAGALMSGVALKGTVVKLK